MWRDMEYFHSITLHNRPIFAVNIVYIVIVYLLEKLDLEAHSFLEHPSQKTVRFSEQTFANIRSYFRAKWRLLFVYRSDTMWRDMEYFHSITLHNRPIFAVNIVYIVIVYLLEKLDLIGK